MDPKPVIFYAVTFRCVRKCDFCFNAAVAHEQGIFNWSAYRSLLSEMAEFSKTTGILLRLNLTGGEPLLEPRIGELALQAKDLAIPIALTTAGLPIPDKRLRELTKAGTEVTISFDCCNPVIYEQTRGKGTFALAIGSIEALADTGCLKRAILVLTKETIGWIEQTIALLARYGVKEFILMELTLPPKRFREIGVRIDRSQIFTCQQLEPDASFILGHQCPVTLNVSPNGQYFIQRPPDKVHMLETIARLDLKRVYKQYVRTTKRLFVEPSEVFEPLLVLGLNDRKELE